MRVFIVMLIIVISAIVFQACSSLATNGVIYIDKNPAAKIIDRKDLPERVFDFFKIDSNNFLFLCANDKTWNIRHYSTNKEYKLLNQIDIKDVYETYIHSNIYNHNLVLITSVNYDNYEHDNFIIDLRHINLQNGEVISDKTIFLYPTEEKVKVDNEKITFENKIADVVNSSNNNFFSIYFESYCDYSEQHRLTGSVFDDNTKELYHFTRIFSKNESINDFFLSKNGEFFVSTFLLDDENDKKFSILYKFTKDGSKELKYELPEEILDEDDYIVNGSKIAEDLNDNIVIASTLKEDDDLLGILLAKYDNDKNEYSKTNIFEIDEDADENLDDYHKLTEADFIHFSFFGDNNLILIFEELHKINIENKTFYEAYGERGPVYFLAFNKEFKPMWQNNLKDRQISVLENDLYASEQNSVNCIKNDGKKIDFYINLSEPKYGYYKYEIDLEKNIFKGPELMFEYWGQFRVLKRKFVKNNKGLLFVTNNVKANLLNGNRLLFSQELFNVDFK